MVAADARRYVIVAWLGLIGIQIANQVTKAATDKTGQTSFFPAPNKLLGGAVVYTMLGGLAELAPSLAVAFAAGVDLVVLLGPVVTPANGTGNTLFDRLAGMVKAAA